MSRILIVAGITLMVAASADARPIWRTYPTPLPPEIHLARVRPAWIGPVWRQWYSSRIVSVEFAPTGDMPRADAPDTTVITWKPDPPAADAPDAAAAEAEPAPAPAPAPVVVITKTQEPLPVTPAPILAAAKPAPTPPAAKIVVAQKTPDPPPPSAAPAAAPVMLESTSAKSPWLDYISAFVMAIVLGGVIYFFTRDRKRTA